MPEWLEVLGIRLDTDDITEVRSLILNRKLTLGHEALREMLAPQVKKAERMVHVMRRLSL